ncbi:MAG: MurR/RpiR family transcriptional regulator [Alphaproteobacteria bacterium]
MSTRLSLRIQDCFERLTAGERKLAEVILGNPDDILSYSATELAGMAGVSKSTAARFFRTLGYGDFNEVRLQAREERNKTAPMHLEARAAPSERRPGDIDAFARLEVANLNRTLEALRPDVLAAATELLADAQRVWVLGLGTEEGLARYARLLLARIRPDVRLLGAEAPAEDLAMLGPRDSVLVIAMRPRHSGIRPMLAYADTARAKIVYLTDPVAAGSGTRMARVVLQCHTASYGEQPSYAATLSVVQLLAANVAARLGPRARQRLALIADIHEEMEDLSE